MKHAQLYNARYSAVILCCILCRGGLKISTSSNDFLNNFYVVCLFATKFTEIVWIVTIIVLTKTKDSSIKTTLGIRF